MASRVNTLLSFLLLPAIIAAARSPLEADNNLCVYMVYVRTGSIWKGGTDSVISLAINDTYGDTVYVLNLESWGGLMGPNHDYFERGNLDIFSGRGQCLSSSPCSIELSSDGSGPHHGWYCNYVEVTSTGPHMDCQQQKFTIEQWLARDAAPYKLSAVRDYCDDTAVGARRGERAAV